MPRQMAGDNTPPLSITLHINTLHFRVQILDNPLSLNTRTYVGTCTLIRLHYPILHTPSVMFVLFLEVIVEIHPFLNCLHRSGGWWKSSASGSLSRKKVRECRRKYRVMQQFTPRECSDTSVWRTNIWTKCIVNLSESGGPNPVVTVSPSPSPILISVCIQIPHY